MNTPPSDQRSRFVAPDFDAMEGLVAALVVPTHASMQVMSALETARELIRYSYCRYEFATVAVTHSLMALEQVLAARSGAEAPLPELIRWAVDEGLLAAADGAELERCALLRDLVVRGAVTSGAVRPERALLLVGGVFAAVHTLLDAPVRTGDGLTEQWAEHLGAPFPESFRGVDLAGEDLVLLDADVAGVVGRELDGGLDEEGVRLLRTCIAALDKVIPMIEEVYCARYFGRLRGVARLAVGRYLPPAG